MAAFLDKGWALSTVKKICQHVDRTGSATECKQNAKLVVVGQNLRALKQILLLTFLMLKNR